MFRRSTKDAAGTAQPGDPLGTLNGAPGKGKATPKRREAEAARRTSVFASGAKRTSGKTGRAGRQSPEQARARREALRRGDESVLPPRDRGPARRYARDYVDARRSVIGLFVPVAVPVILLGYTHIRIFVLIANFGLYAFVLGSILDSLRMSRAIHKQVAARYPNEPTKGLGRYAVMRAMQFRKIRLPGPRVARGAKV